MKKLSDFNCCMIINVDPPTLNIDNGTFEQWGEINVTVDTSLPVSTKENEKICLEQFILNNI